MALTLGLAGVASVAAVAGVLGAAQAEDLYDSRRALANRPQDIIFPPDLLRNPNAQVPFMSMEFERYQRRSINEQPFYNSVMKIRLPIPENLSETTSLSYDNANLGSAMGSLIEAGSARTELDLGTRGVTLAAGAATAAAGNAGAAVTAVAQTAGGRAGAERAAPLAANAQLLADAARISAGALFGITANPYQVTLFKSPNFRTHKFSWKFIATSLEESNTLRNLVSILKYHSLPGISSAGAVFFSYPEILKINFRPSDRFLYKFKPCVVTGLTVNYAPNSPSFVKTSGAPTAIMISIDLQEIEILTKADFLRDERGYYSPSTGQLIQDVQRSVEQNI